MILMHVFFFLATGFSSFFFRFFRLFLFAHISWSNLARGSFVYLPSPICEIHLHMYVFGAWAVALPILYRLFIFVDFVFSFFCIWSPLGEYCLDDTHCLFLVAGYLFSNICSCLRAESSRFVSRCSSTVRLLLVAGCFPTYARACVPTRLGLFLGVALPCRTFGERNSPLRNTA